MSDGFEAGLRFALREPAHRPAGAARRADQHGPGRVGFIALVVVDCSRPRGGADFVVVVFVFAPAARRLAEQEGGRAGRADRGGSARAGIRPAAASVHRRARCSARRPSRSPSARRLRGISQSDPGRRSRGTAAASLPTRAPAALRSNTRGTPAPRSRRTSPRRRRAGPRPPTGCPALHSRARSPRPRRRASLRRR